MRKHSWVITAAVALLVGAAAGWFAKSVSSTPASAPAGNDALRAGGYDLINPLLLCQTTDREVAENKALERKLADVVDAKTSDGTFTAASVYVRGIPGGQWAEVNSDERYYPASMEKVPVMMAYLSLAESDPGILSKRMTYPGGADADVQQEVPVQDPLVAGASYSALELIEHMILHSDNNATRLLFGSLDQAVFRGAFSELHVPFLGPGEAPADFMTARDYSLFLRVLYNATYLGRTLSEKALQLLVQSDFKDGIVAGVPQGTRVAHKFGLVSVIPDGKNVSLRELHDCGLVYAGENPYVLCVMTKGTSSLERMKAGIADISRAAYEDYQKNLKEG